MQADCGYATCKTLLALYPVTNLKLSDIFREGSEARKLFAKFYAVGAIGVILAVLALLALATRGA